MKQNFRNTIRTMALKIVERPTVSLIIQPSWIGVLLVILMVLAFANLLVAMPLQIQQRAEAFKFMPLWIVLGTLCLTAHGRYLPAILLGLVLCAGNEYVCYLKEAPKDREKFLFEDSPAVLMAEAIIILFVDLLTAAKIENLTSSRDQAQTLVRKAENDLADFQEKIRAKKEDAQGGGVASQADGDSGLKAKILEMQQVIYRNVFKLRARREVPKFLENLLSKWFGFTDGIVFEIGDDAKDLRLRNHWGRKLAERTDALSHVSSFKENTFVRWVSDRREPVSPDEAKKDMALFDAMGEFEKGLFPVELVLPVLVNDKVAFVTILGRAKDAAPKGPLAGGADLPYDWKVLQPLIAALSMAVVRVSVKDARATSART